MARRRVEPAENDRILFVLTYLFSILSGIIVYFLVIPGSGGVQRNKKLARHALQAIALGVVLIAVAVGLFFLPLIVRETLEVLVWFSGVYVGYRASKDSEVDIPYITDYANATLTTG